MRPKCEIINHFMDGAKCRDELPNEIILLNMTYCCDSHDIIHVIKFALLSTKQQVTKLKVGLQNFLKINYKSNFPLFCTILSYQT